MPQRDREIRDLDEPFVAHASNRFAREKENSGFAQFHVENSQNWPKLALNCSVIWSA